MSNNKGGNSFNEWERRALKKAIVYTMTSLRPNGANRLHLRPGVPEFR